MFVIASETCCADITNLCFYVLNNYTQRINNKMVFHRFYFKVFELVSLYIT
ncbi:hypothetical protein L1276_003584 [Flavobacterium sp. HSC-32F16]|nr:hypothetical protein [Flavobacterium sp. HSC-32F16]